MVEKMNIIVLDVCGSIVKVDEECLMNMGYFRNIFLDTDVEYPLFVDFSPKVFNHVVAFVGDSMYPFPEKYGYALDFFGVDYVKDELHIRKYKRHSCCNTFNELDYCVRCYCKYDGCRKRVFSGIMYCSQHKCAVCNGSVINEKVKYCGKHKCSFSVACDRMAIVNGYCCAHICGYENCDECAHYNLKRSCMTHKCRDDNCVNVRYKYSGYCLDHYCTVEKCGEKRIIGKKYCVDHKCSIGNCFNKCDGHSKYCQPHFRLINKCLVDNCKNMKGKYSGYCCLHYCAIENCQNVGVCGAKYKLKDNFRSERIIGENWCCDHKCAINNCGNKRSGGYNYCWEHNCIVDDCYNERADKSDYCLEHVEYDENGVYIGRCLFDDCENNCNGIDKKGHKFCGDHYCKKDGCDMYVMGKFCYNFTYIGLNNIDGVSDYCWRHKCSDEYCMNVVKNAYFCESHCCGFVGCNSWAVYDGGVSLGYCPLHLEI